MNINPNEWSCLPTAFANLIDMPIGEFINDIGHDGSELPFDPPFTHVRRGFHVQECIEVLDQYGYSATRIEVRPMLAAHEAGMPIEVDMGECPVTRLRRHMDFSHGVIIGRLLLNTPIKGHAVSWMRGKCYDPRGAGLVWRPEDLLYKYLDPWEFYMIGGLL